MTWARLDDRFWSNRKIRQAWKACRAAVGLHVMAITYCAMHETDGVIDADFVEALIPNTRERKQTLDALITAGLWHAASQPGFYCLNDYLEFNPSSSQIAARRKRDADRKAQARAADIGADTHPESAWIPNGVRAESARSPRGIHAPGPAGIRRES